MLYVFWQNLLLVLITFLALDLVLGFIFFYVYYLKAQEEESVTSSILQVNHPLLESVFSRWNEKELRHQEALSPSREFPDLFREMVPQAPSIEPTSLQATTSRETSEE